MIRGGLAVLALAFAGVGLSARADPIPYVADDPSTQSAQDPRAIVAMLRRGGAVGRLTLDELDQPYFIGRIGKSRMVAAFFGCDAAQGQRHPAGRLERGAPAVRGRCVGAGPGVDLALRPSLRAGRRGDGHGRRAGVVGVYGGLQAAGRRARALGRGTDMGGEVFVLGIQRARVGAREIEQQRQDRGAGRAHGVEIMLHAVAGQQGVIEAA